MSNSIILFLIIGTLVGILAYIFYYNRKASKAKGEQKKKIKTHFLNNHYFSTYIEIYFQFDRTMVAMVKF